MSKPLKSVDRKVVAVFVGLAAGAGTGMSFMAPAAAQADMPAQMQMLQEMQGQMATLRAQPRTAAGPGGERRAQALSERTLMGVTLPGVSTGTAVISYLRFSNGDSSAQPATVILRDPATGAVLVSWQSPRIAAGGTLEVAVPDILAGTLGDTAARLPPTAVADITGAFIGHVQHVTLSQANGALSNVSTCGMVLMADPLSLSYVTGPGRSDLAGFIGITNGAQQPAALRLTLVDNAGRASLWTSPMVEAEGSVNTAVADIAAQATPPIDAAARSLSVVADAALTGVTLSYSEGLPGSATFDDFSAACMLTTTFAAAP